MIISKSKRIYSKFIDYIATNNDDSLYCVYENPSAEKQYAMRRLKQRLINQYNCKDFKVLSGNSWTYTVGCIGEYKGKKSFFYITKCKDYVMVLE